jgi:hypothetical protein
LLLGARAAQATHWRGNTELTFQTQEVRGSRTDFWRYFLDLAAEDRMFYRNRILLRLRLEGRSFGTAGQQREWRPRFNWEITGAGYVFTGLYAPNKRQLEGAVDERERQYNVSLSVFPQHYPVTTLTWNRFTRSLNHAPNDRRDVFTLTMDYARGIWRGQGRLLHQIRDFTGAMTNERITSLLANNIVSINRRYWRTSLRYQLDYTDQRFSAGLEGNTTVHVFSGQLWANPNRKLVATLDVDSRFASNRQDTAVQSTEDYTFSGRVSYRPWRPLEFGAVRFYSSNGVSTTGDEKQIRDFTQVQAGLNGRFLSSLLGAFSVSRTWNHSVPNVGKEQDAVYVRLAGDLFARTSVAVEGSYSDLNIGERPISSVRSATLNAHILRDSRFQLQYGAIGSSSDVNLWSIERQNISVNWQQYVSGATYVTVGWNRLQERAVSDSWRSLWYVTGSISLRKWALLSGQYNRVNEIVVPKSPVQPLENPTRSEFQLTIYPEQRWVWSANWYQSKNAAGQYVTFWGGSIRYRF